MFGDPITNEKGWAVKKLGEEFEVSSGGTPDTKNPSYWDNGDISWIGSNMCQNEIIYQNDGKHITADGLSHSSAKEYHNGYVLVALVGATIGKVALLKFMTTTNQNIAGINVPANKEYTCEYVFYLMQNLYNLFREVGGDKFKMANLSFVRSLPIPKPSYTLQQQFADKIEVIEKQKELIKQSITQTEELFNSRMDYYFN
jgi:type I restriction enzyme S subunit